MGAQCIPHRTGAVATSGAKPRERPENEGIGTQACAAVAVMAMKMTCFRMAAAVLSLLSRLLRVRLKARRPLWAGFSSQF